MQLERWINEQQPTFTKALEELVNINTFTDNHVGVDSAMDHFCQIAQNMGFHIEVINGRHRLVKAGNGKGKRVLLISHIDTVHPPDGTFLKYEPLEDGYVRGPGIGDMKGGLLMGLWTLFAMSQLREDFDVQLIVSAEEETGSQTLNEWYQSEDCVADFALGLEPGFPQGALSPTVQMGVVKQRKGCGRIAFTVKGKAAHSGGAWEKGLNAVEAAAQRIIKIHALSNFEKGITTSVGVVKGGTAANTIAEYCTAEIDFRYLTRVDGDATLQAIRDIINEPVVFNPYLNINETVEDVNLSVYMPPMEYTPESKVIIDVVLEEAARLGQDVVPIARGGGSDANYTSSNNIPSICGMGAPAEAIHTTDEKIHLPYLWQRLDLLISTVDRLTCL